MKPNFIHLYLCSTEWWVGVQRIVLPFTFSSYSVGFQKEAKKKHTFKLQVVNTVILLWVSVLRLKRCEIFIIVRIFMTIYFLVFRWIIVLLEFHSHMLYYFKRWELKSRPLIECIFSIWCSFIYLFYLFFLRNYKAVNLLWSTAFGKTKICTLYAHILSGMWLFGFASVAMIIPKQKHCFSISEQRRKQISTSIRFLSFAKRFHVQFS